jgi:hypothetical protein
MVGGLAASFLLDLLVYPALPALDVAGDDSRRRDKPSLVCDPQRRFLDPS